MHQIMEFRALYFTSIFKLQVRPNCLYTFMNVFELILPEIHPLKVNGCKRFIWMLIKACVNNGLLVVVALFLPDPMNTSYFHHFGAENEARGWLYWSWLALEYMSDVQLLKKVFAPYAHANCYTLQLLKGSIQGYEFSTRDSPFHKLSEHGNKIFKIPAPSASTSA